MYSTYPSTLKNNDISLNIIMFYLYIHMHAQIPETSNCDT